VGVVLHAFGIPPRHVRANYRLRGNHDQTLRSALRDYFDELTPEDCAVGDALLLRVAPEQVHLAVSCGGTFVHADAGIGRVVETPAPPAWPVISVHRFRISGEI
jgi:hypothetical protein